MRRKDAFLRLATAYFIPKPFKSSGTSLSEKVMFWSSSARTCRMHVLLGPYGSEEHGGGQTIPIPTKVENKLGYGTVGDIQRCFRCKKICRTVVGRNSRAGSEPAGCNSVRENKSSTGLGSVSVNLRNALNRRCCQRGSIHTAWWRHLQTDLPPGPPQLVTTTATTAVVSAFLYRYAVSDVLLKGSTSLLPPSPISFPQQ